MIDINIIVTEFTVYIARLMPNVHITIFVLSCDQAFKTVSNYFYIMMKFLKFHVIKEGSVDILGRKTSFETSISYD